MPGEHCHGHMMPLLRVPGHGAAHAQRLVVSMGCDYKNTHPTSHCLDIICDF